MNKILVIEDNTEVRENTAEIIELANYEVLTAENGKIGVEIALKENPDLIVCDIMMPVLDGYGVYHSLSKHTTTASIPFIFLTAKSEKADFRRGMEMGADDYLMKPFEGIDLLHAIEIRLEKNDLLKKQYSGPGALNAFLEEVQRTGQVSLGTAERETVNYPRKLQVYKEGQHPRMVYLVISGSIKISKTNDDGKEFITNILGPDEYFGYTSILEDVNYKENAEARDDSTLMLIPREDFSNLVLNDITVARTFLKIITQNIVEKEEDLLNLAYSSLRKKVAYGLIQLMEKFKIEDSQQPALNLSRETWLS